jgi:hypothetical protein
VSDDESTRLVAEDGRVAPGPLPHRRRARDLGVRDLLRVAEVAGLDADRAQPQLAAAVRELLEELLERRAALAGDALASPGSTSRTAFFVAQITTCLPWLSAAVATRKATVTRSASSRPVARLTSALLFTVPSIAVSSLARSVVRLII